MSSEDGNVSWKLNDLIHASRRAAYRRYESLEHADKEQEFLPWTPTMLKLIDDQIVESDTNEGPKDSSSDTHDDDESLAPVIEEKLVPEEQMMAKVQESYQRGFEEGKVSTESELADKFLKLDKFIQGFADIQGNLEEFHSPLVKLSLAIANHLVRAELRLDAAAIHELVSQSLSAIDKSSEEAVVVYLPEEDFEDAERVLVDAYPSVKFEIDSELSLGSLRVVMDDTSIEDLIENRLDALAEQLFRKRNQIASSPQQFAESDKHDAEKLISIDDDLTGSSNTNVSRPISSPNDDFELIDEDSIDETSEPSVTQDSNVEIITTEEGVGTAPSSAPEEVGFESDDNEDA